ncbi:MAG TPA: AMP-binding protein [Marmoricola sp.]|nr:AMP-binding protein [Marmoricola sp.]
MDLTRLAAEDPGKAAVLDAETGEQISYGELEARSNRIAHALRRRGLVPGSHLAVLSPNTLDLFPVVWAAQRSGLLHTPVNWHLAADEATYIVENCEAMLLVHDDSLAELAASIAAATGVPLLTFAALEAEAATEPATPIGDQAEGYYMFYSSGTTGRPKGILPELPNAPFGTGLQLDHMMAGYFGFGPDTVYLSPGPMYHAAPMGWSFGALRNGGTVVMLPRFDAELALQAIEQYDVTHGQFVPTMFVRMLKLAHDQRAAYDVSSLQVVIHAAAPCPIEVKEQMIAWFGPKLLEYYSGSEGAGFFMIDSAAWANHKGSVGQSVFGVPHVLDDDGAELPTGEIGQIWFSGSAPFEYHGDAEKTAGAYNDRGWSTLGDLGHLDEDGFLYLSDRRTDLILSGGVNIYPREIEDVLVLHPDVDDVAVIGVPDAEFGQSVHAVIQPAPGVSLDGLDGRISEFLRERIAGFKVPRSFAFGEVPRLPSGKVLRRHLMKSYSERPQQR